MTVPPESHAQLRSAFGEAPTGAHDENSSHRSSPKQNVLRQADYSLSELEKLQARIAAVETGIEWGKTG